MDDKLYKESAWKK